MTFDWGEDPLGGREIVSVHKAVTVFNARAAAPGGNGLRKSLAQMKLLSDANCLGFTYLSVTEVETRYHRKEVLEGLALQPVWSRGSLARHLDATFEGRAPAVLILRQRESRQIAEDEQDVYGPDGRVVYHRAWYGYDRRMDHSRVEAERRAQDDATREVWAVSAARACMVEECAAAGVRLPLVVSVGGLIVSGREIVGFDHARERAGRLTPQRSFEVRQAGGWFEPLRDTWLESGAGKAALWWDLPVG